MDTSQKQHVIIGTAGHIDHGKTALVKALTGVDADTLSEEKRRGITIELGFVFLEMPESKRQIVFIDVPGHEKLVKTMVAGASNIDAALLVVAADEGVNVQTEEHFDILQLLNIDRGIIVLTKTDLVDEGQIDRVKSEVEALVRKSFLEEAPILPVSAVSGSGIEKLKEALVKLAEDVDDRYDRGVFRMPVDRVFTMSGFGTVIAGTVLSGSAKIGDRLTIYPEGLTSRVRGIHVHHNKVENSSIGRRTALNLPEIKKEDLRRGQCAAKTDSLFPTYRLDGRLYLLKSYGKELKNRARVRLHIGTDEVICRLTLLDRNTLAPGESGFVQFVLDSPTVALPKDSFVIRTFSPLMTIGGGVILDADPPKHKRLDDQTLKGLQRLEGGEKSVVEQMFWKSRFFPQSVAGVALKMGERESSVEKAIQSLLRGNKIIPLLTKDKDPQKKIHYLHQQAYQAFAERIVKSLEDFLAQNPSIMEMPVAELRSKFLKMTDAKTFNAVVDSLQDVGRIYYKGSSIGIAGYEVSLSSQEMTFGKRVEDEFKKAGFKAPLEEDVRNNLGIKDQSFKKVMTSLLAQKKLFRLSDKVTYHLVTIQELQNFVVEYIERHGRIKLSDLRDELQFSRKYAQAVLEYFDDLGLTKRIDDYRILV
ncbi:selenocysteine-specific translation elongation factor [Acidobacteriota bacterium]